MPASMSLERRALLEAYGAEIVLTEPEEAMEGAVREALRSVEERGAFMPQQVENEANPRVHREKTAKEIVEAFGDELPDALVVAVGFFFQAEDGIRDLYVTGVQTCALPI